MIKSKLLKVWGIMLTLAILGGLMVPMATPTAVSAGDAQWTEIITPNYTTGQLRPGSDVDFLAVGPDGKTMFAYSNAVATTMTAASLAAAVAITVDSTEGFNLGDAITVGTGSPVAEVPAGGVLAKTASTITVAALANAHPAGDVVTNASVVTGRLVKSTDGGITFSGVNIGVGTGAAGSGLNGVAISALAISTDYTNDQTVVAAEAAALNIRRSVDAGQTWSVAIPIPAGVGTIRSIAVGPWYKGGQAILVGYSNGAAGGGVSLYKTIDLGWENLAAVGGWVAADVLAVGFSPNHKTDAMIVVICATAADTFMRARLAANNWGADIDEVEIRGDGAVALPTAAALRASMAFPKDFEWSSNFRVLVGTGQAGAGTYGACDAYRVQGALAGGTSRAYDLNANGTGVPTDVSGLAFKGNIADGRAVVGQENTRDILSSNNVTASVVTWVTSTKNVGPVATPLVGTVVSAVVASPTTDAIYAAATGPQSGLYESLDGAVSFNGLSLLDISAASRTQLTSGLQLPTATTWLHVIKDDADAGNTNTANDVFMMFKTLDAGKTWKMVLQIRATGANDRISSFNQTRTFSTDGTIFVWQADTRFWKSSNGGDTWVGYTAQDNITAFSIVDKDTYFTGHINKVYKSGRFTEATLDGETAFIIRSIDANTLGCSTSTGDILISTDDGVTWSRLGPADSFGAGNRVYYAPDPKYATNKIIYAGSTANATIASSGIYRWIMGSSSQWELIKGEFAAGTNDIRVVGFEMSTDGTLYALSSVAGVSVYREVAPSSAIADLNPERMTNAQLLGWQAAFTGVTLKRLSTATDNTMYAVVGGAPAGSFLYPFRLLTFKDSLVNGPAVVNPKAGTSTGPRDITLQWSSITSAVQLTYAYQIATDATMQGTVVGGLGATTVGLLGKETTAISAFEQNALIPGKSYWWRARVQTGKPLTSRWTTATAFSAKLGEAQFAVIMITPDPRDAIRQPIRPIFSWQRVEGADSYELELADNPFFGTAQAKKPLMNTVWAWDKDLEYETTYYFRVRAISGKNVSEWVQGVFSTMAKPAPVVTAPPAAPKVEVILPTAAPVKKYFDPQSGLYFDSEAELKAYQTAHPPGTGVPTTPAYIWAIIIIGAVLVIAVIVLIVRTRRVA